MYKRLDIIPACDGQTDGQTFCHGIVRAMHTRRAVKIDYTYHVDSSSDHKVTSSYHYYCKNRGFPRQPLGITFSNPKNPFVIKKLATSLLNINLGVFNSSPVE